MPINFAQLKIEIETDPSLRGYAAHLTTGSDHKTTDLLNALTTSTVERDIVSAHEVYEAILPAEWAALTSVEKQRVQTLLGMGQVNLKGSNTRASLGAVFITGTTTRGNLLALQTRVCSRAEQLFGTGTVITPEEVAKALRG